MMTSFHRATAIVLRQLYLMRGSPARILPLFAWVSIEILLWGFITRYLNTITAAGIDFVPVLLGAVLLWSFFTRVMYGVSTAFFEDVWSRNFLNLFASPISITEYLTGLVLASILTSLVGLLAMVFLATAVFGLSFFAYGFILIPFLLVLFLFGTALGITGVAIVLRLGPAAEWLIWPLPALISPFVGVFYPISTLPKWMQYFAQLFPPTYVFEGLRTIVSGGAVSLGALLSGASLALLYILLACWFFVRVYRRAVRTGLIARYSAETLS